MTTTISPRADRGASSPGQTAQGGRVSAATKADLLRDAARAARGSVHGAIDRLDGARTPGAGVAMRSLARHCADFIRRTGLSPERFTVDWRGRIVVCGSRRAVGYRAVR